MTVNGSTTAVLATTTYVPPYQYVTSYAASAHVTGSVTSALPVNPTVTSSASSNGDYATAYLTAHMMSWPSYRYAYLLWMVLAFLAAVYALSHHLRLSGGSLGAAYARWGIRRKVFGRKTASGSRRGTTLPSNNMMVAITILLVVTIVLCLIGSDYVRPSSSTLDFSTSFRKRASVSYSIPKSFWTSGSRFGFMAFALMPLVVLFALKAPPFALLAVRAFTHVYSDKLALLHRAAAWIVWGFTTIHVVLWTIQLFQDQRNGRAVWFIIFNSYRFIFGCVAYGMMTAVMALSLRPVRKHSYEFFYMAHVTFVFLTIVCSAIHHPVLWFWMAGALGLWACERAIRLVRMARINGLFKRKGKYTSLVAGRPYDDSSYVMADLKRESEYPNPYDKTLPRAPQAPRDKTPEAEFGQRADSGYFDAGSLQPLGSYEARQSHGHNQSQSHEYGHNQSLSHDSHMSYPNSPSPSRPLTPAYGNHERAQSVMSTGPLRPNSYAPTEIPIGYAQAQLLPSRTVRLTIKLARPLHRTPGQSVLLYLPDLSLFQSHPFTILNNDPTEIMLLIKARKGLTRKLFDMVRQKSLAAVGVSSSRDKRVSLATMRTGDAGITVPPIFLKALVDGPMGSSERVRWQEYSTVLIICGGSGVSFGAAVCEHVCSNIKRRVGKTQRVRFCWVVREYAEIAWVAGQLRRCQDMVSAEQLQIDIFVTNGEKTTDEFAPPRPGFAAAGHQRRGSADSVASDMSTNGPVGRDETVDNQLAASYADVIDLTNYEDEEDIDDPAENRLSNRLAQQGKVKRARSRRAAKVRSSQLLAKSPPHAHSRLDQSQEQQGTYHPGHRPESSYSSAEDQYAAAASGHYSPHVPVYSPLRDETTSPLAATIPLSQPMMPASSSMDKRQSFQSFADSTYGRYDPFSGGSGGGSAGGLGLGRSGSSYGGWGPSPSASMFFDDAQSISGESMRDLLSRSSRTQSMVLLENGAGADPSGDAGLWIDGADYAAMGFLSEMARAGRPQLSAVMEEEIETAQGSMLVAACGPVALNTVVRTLVSKNISPSRIRRGDKRGHIVVYTEDYEG
ncbi:hypothetical protein IAT38_006721 [Cryptococcus sp. DSM 104549]